ncbi:hypothetical protein FDENT_9654 [Fusarium denticulatum]|uniref:Uncharacterized protein n=1 Tax=Fusarium denticulatum TaxID=48507 RepID=A0A8H5TUJ6_9HYPO|nr:hypothetical protein FDENT_9654 [Fusarium denticulatum]
MDRPPTPSSVEPDDPWPEFSDAELESYQKSIENPSTSPDRQVTLENHRQTHTDISAEDSETAVLMYLREAAQESLKPGPSSELELQFTWGFLEHFSKPPKQPKSLPDPTEFTTLKGKKQTHSVHFAEDPDIISDSAMTIFYSIDDLQEKFQKETPCDTTEAMSPILQKLRLLNHEAMCAKVLHASHKLGNWSLGLDINMLQARRQHSSSPPIIGPSMQEGSQQCRICHYHINLLRRAFNLGAKIRLCAAVFFTVNVSTRQTYAPVPGRRPSSDLRGANQDR